MKAALFACVASLAIATAAHAETILVNDGRVVTNAGAVLPVGDVLIRDGKIAAVGASIAAPAGARVIEAKGKWVTPGVFASMSQVGLSEISGSGAPNDASVSGDLVSAAADAAVAFNPDVTAVSVTRIEGVTRAAIAPSAGGTIFGGRGALVTFNGGANSVFKAGAFQMLMLGEEGAERSGGSRASLWPTLQAALRDAREYPGRYRSGQGGAVLSEVDAEALQPFARGEGLFIVQIDAVQDLRQLLTFARANPQLRFAIYGGAEAWQIAPELAAAKIPVIVDPLVNLPDHFEHMSARLDNAALLQKAGVVVAIAPAAGSVDAHQTRLVLQLAGNAVANGMPWDAAFAAVTKTPAAIFGVSRDFGTLEAGKVADVVVWDGDPLDVLSAPTAVLIAGEETSLESRQTRLRDRYRPKR